LRRLSTSLIAKNGLLGWSREGKRYQLTARQITISTSVNAEMFLADGEWGPIRAGATIWPLP
jgi:hypothetical protein